MTVYLYTSPFTYQHPILVQHKSAALDAANLFAIHVFHPDDVKQAASALITIGEQLEGKTELGLEVFMRLQAIPRNTHDFRIQRLEIRISIAKLLALGGAAWCRILGIKIDDEGLAEIVREFESFAAGGRQFKIGNGLIQHNQGLSFTLALLLKNALKARAGTA